MKVLIVRREQLRIHQDFLYVKLYAKKHGVDADIKTYTQSRRVDDVIHYLKLHGTEFDMILLDGEIGCTSGKVFNPDLLSFLIGPDAAYMRHLVVIRSNSPYCIEKAHHNQLNAVGDNESWRINEYVFALTMPAMSMRALHANTGLMVSHI